MARRRRNRKPRSRRRYYRRPRRRATTLVRVNPRRRYRRRRNPVLPTRLFQRGLAVAAGFLATPMLANMIPFTLPGGKLGEYAKKFIIVSVGSGILGRTLGRQYGNALFAGGVIHIGVDLLQTFVPAFGGGNGGVGYYFPPDDQLSLSYGTGTEGNGVLPAETFQSGGVSRLSSRFG